MKAQVHPAVWHYGRTLEAHGVPGHGLVLSGLRSLAEGSGKHPLTPTPLHMWENIHIAKPVWWSARVEPKVQPESEIGYLFSSGRESGRGKGLRFPS